MKKRILLFTFVVLSIIAVLSICTFAVNYLESKTQIEVIFDDNSVFSDEQKTIITEYFQNHADTHEEISSKGILCSLFGHKIQTECVDIIIHKYYPTIPRCVRETYMVDLCTRCDYTESQIVERACIFCCPED